MCPYPAMVELGGSPKDADLAYAGLAKHVNLFPLGHLRTRALCEGYAQRLRCLFSSAGLEPQQASIPSIETLSLRADLQPED